MGTSFSFSDKHLQGDCKVKGKALCLELVSQILGIVSRSSSATWCHLDFKLMTLSFKTELYGALWLVYGFDTHCRVEFSPNPYEV